MRKLLALLPAVFVALLALAPALADHTFPGQGSYPKWQAANRVYNDGIVLLRSGKYREAVESFDKAIAIYPHDDDYYYNRGLAEDKLGALTAAESSYKRALSVNPNMWQAWNNLASVYFAQKRYTESKDAAQRALGSVPPPPPADQADLKAGIAEVDKVLATKRPVGIQ